MASKKGCLDIVKYLIELGVNVNVKDHSGKKPIHLSCEKGCRAVTMFLLENGTVLEKDDHCKDLLMNSLTFEIFQLTNVILDQKVFDPDLQIPFEKSLSRGHFQIALRMFQNGAKLDEMHLVSLSKGLYHMKVNLKLCLIL